MTMTQAEYDVRIKDDTAPLRDGVTWAAGHQNAGRKLYDDVIATLAALGTDEAKRAADAITPFPGEHLTVGELTDNEHHDLPAYENGAANGTLSERSRLTVQFCTNVCTTLSGDRVATTALATACGLRLHERFTDPVVLSAVPTTGREKSIAQKQAKQDAARRRWNDYDDRPLPDYCFVIGGGEQGVTVAGVRPRPTFGERMREGQPKTAREKRIAERAKREASNAHRERMKRVDALRSAAHRAMQSREQ